MKTLLTLKRFNQNMELLERREQRSLSWLKHSLDIFYTLISNLDLVAINDITGVARTMAKSVFSPYPYANLMVGSPPGSVQFFAPDGSQGGYQYGGAYPLKGEDLGIVVGTGGGAVTPTQDALQAKVAHGEAAGVLLHGGCELYGLSFVNPNGQFTIRRYFTNVLGGVITVQEVGIYSCTKSAPAATVHIFCIARDVVAPGITVNNGEILEVTYTPQITV